MTAPDRVQDVLLPDVIRLAVSSAFHNKDILPTHDKNAYGNSFQSQDIAPLDLIAHITTGNAFTMGAFSEGRKKETFVSGHLVGLDLDNNISVGDCLAHDFICQYAYLIYPTPSSGKPDENGNPIYKSRVLFILDTPVTDRVAWERKQRALLWHCNTLSPDPACKDAARLFFGSETTDYYTQDAVLPVAILDDLASQMESEIGAYEAERTQAENDRIKAQNRRNVSDDKKRERYYKYASTALDNMVSDLGSMSPGSGRNNALYKYGAKAGNFVSAGMISYSEAEAALRGAALSSGLDSREISNTLPRALNDGQSTPYDTYELDRKFEQWVRDREQFKATAQDNLQAINEVYQQAKAEAESSVTDYATYYETPAGIIEMAQHAHAQWLHGVRRSWWQVWKGIPYRKDVYSDDIPVGHVSAIMHLNNTRSSTALVLGRMHQAFIDGRLSHAIFSIPLVAEAIGLSVRVVSNAFIELEQGGYIRFVDTYSLYNILHTVYNNMSPQTSVTPYLNVTPARLYVANFNTQDLNARLYHQLAVKKTEDYHRRTVAKTTQRMADDMGLSFDEFKQLQSLDDYFAKDTLSKKAQAELRNELEGAKNSDWRGWKATLRGEFSIPIDWQACGTIKDVRGAMLKYWIQNVRKQNSRKQLARLLGCSETTLDNLYSEFDIVPVKQYGESDIKPTVTDLRPVLQNIVKEHRAEIMIVSFKLEDNAGWQTVNKNYAPRYYKDHKHEITDVWVKYIEPSIQYTKSVASWALKWQQFIIAVAYWMHEKHTDILTGETVLTLDDIADIKPVIRSAKAKDSRPAEDKTTLVMQHVYEVHTDRFCNDQMATRVTMATGYKVVGDSVVQDMPPSIVSQWITPFLTYEDADRYKNHRTQVIFMPLRGKRNAGLLQFIQDNKADKLVCKSHEVFGKEIEDYNDELNAEYKAEREKEIEILLRREVDRVDVPDFDISESVQLEFVETVADALPKPRIETERLRLFIEFCNNRYEREHTNRKRVFMRAG